MCTGQVSDGGNIKIVRLAPGARSSVRPDKLAIGNNGTAEQRAREREREGLSFQSDKNSIFLNHE